MEISDFRNLLRDEMTRLKTILDNSKEEQAKKLEKVIGILNNPDFNTIIKQLGLIKFELKDILTSDELEKMITELKEIVESLKSHQINNTLDEESAQQYINKFLQIRNIIENELYATKLRISNKMKIVEKLRKYRGIEDNLRNHEPIAQYQINIIKQLLDIKKVEETKQIILLERIKIANVHVKNNATGQKPRNISQLYEIINMLKYGYEKNPQVNIEDPDDRHLVETYKSTYISVLKDFSLEELKDNIESFPNLNSKQFSYEVFYYTMIEILNYLQQEMLEAKEYIEQRIIYDDKTTRDESKKDYYDALDKYLYLREYFYKEIDEYNTSLLEENDDLLNNINNVCYLISKEDESFLEKDMDNIPKEYLYKVKILLNKLKQDRLAKGESKTLTDFEVKGRKALELKDDQVRIIYYHVSNNNYIILGCGTKKTDNDRVFYNKMCDRIKYVKDEEEIIENQEQKQEVEERINEYIENNKRKGTR